MSAPIRPRNVAPLSAETLPLLVALAKVRTGERVLDLGCSDSSLVDALTTAGFDAVGVTECADAVSDRVVLGSPEAGLPVETDGAQLVIVRGTHAFRPTHLADETYVGLANVLANVSNEATIAFPNHDERMIATLHRFGLKAAKTPLGKPVGLIGRLLGRKPKSLAEMIVATLDGAPRTKLEYHGIAREAVVEQMRRAA